jgi:hypothetical protein
MMGLGFEHSRCNPLGFIRTLRPQGQDRGLQGLLGIAGRRIERRV